MSLPATGLALSCFEDTDTAIEIIAPPGLAGMVDVTVSTAAGTSTTSTVDHFTYQAATAPVVNAIDPPNGFTGGGGIVTIYGSGLGSVTTVKFGTTASTSFYSVSRDTLDTELQVVAPSGSGTVDVTVVSGSGTSTTGPGDRFSFVSAPLPQVYALAPHSGPAGGGNFVIIYGSGLTAATAVNFGTVSASFVMISDTEIDARAPAQAAGTVADVRVVSPGGTSPITYADRYTYVTTPRPVVWGVAPNQLVAAGGDSVRIFGSGFTGATAVHFGAIAAATFTVEADDFIYVSNAPAGSPGTVDVTVTVPAPGGTSATGPADQVTYLTPTAPSVYAVDPNHGMAAGGAPITITGRGFSGATSVTVGGAAATFTINSDREIQATVPAGTASATPVDVLVTTGAGTSAAGNGDHFTYTVSIGPGVTAISPTSGPAAGGTTVYVTGRNFTGATAVKYGTAAAASFTVLSDTALQTTSPAQGALPATVDITVTTPAGTSTAVPADTYTYGNPPPPTTPVISAVYPNSGSTAGGTNVTIMGTGFTGASSVHFGTGIGLGLFVISDTQAQVTSPSGTVGAVDITITTGAGTSPNGTPDLFTYFAPPVPVVSAVAPSQGPSVGGTTIEISGSGLSNPTLVTVGGVSVVFNPISDDRVEAVTPGGTTGSTVDVVVSTAGGSSATSAADHFTYTATPAPVVTAALPASGPASGQTPVLISGQNLYGATAVKFGNANAAGIVVDASGGLIQAISPPAANGTVVAITVTTPGGTTATAGAPQFSYTATPVPTVAAVAPNSATCSGGNLVYVTGSGFTLVTAVNFGTQVAPASTIQVLSSGLLTVQSPVCPQYGAVVDVQVTAAGGTSATISFDHFTYANNPVTATVSWVSPNSGSMGGGTVVYIGGSALTGATQVRFSPTGVNRTAISYQVISDTLIQAVSPMSPNTTPGTVVDIVINTVGATSATGLGDKFTYNAGPTPAVTALNASSGPAGTIVYITGSGFNSQNPGVLFGSVGVAQVYVILLGDNLIKVFSPINAALGTVHVTVGNWIGNSTNTAADQYTYAASPRPTVTGVSPSSGPGAGGTLVYVLGSGFGGWTAVNFGPTVATYSPYPTMLSDGLIQVTSPAGTGTVDVTVVSSGGTSATSAADHFFYPSIPPSVTKLVPNTGPTGGGTSVVITGVGFTGFTAVNFGSTPATTVTFNSDTQLTAVSPAGFSTVDVTVVTPAGTSPTTAADNFNYGGLFTAVSQKQYSLANNNGTTWVDMDTNLLTLTVSPDTNAMLVLSANVDLWTANAGINQDFGIFVSSNGGSSWTLPVWKESGGFAGTFSPNAAMAQGVAYVNAGTTYTVKLKWKANKPAPAGGDTILAGASPAAPYSPTRLTGQLVPNSTGNVRYEITSQPQLANSDGVTWKSISPVLGFSYYEPQAQTVIITGNADLWTANAGYNQDIGIQGGVTFGPTSILAWKESGGFAGTYSPNAAFVQAVVTIPAFTHYDISLVWKTNKNATGATIVAGAGPVQNPSNGQSIYSQTGLTITSLPSPDPTLKTAVANQQYHLTSSDGVTWMDMDPANLTTSITPSTNCFAIIGANVDLWTANAGYNQDIAINVNGSVAAWKESGGFAGTYSPNAAFVHTVYQMTAGTLYTIKLQWKANKSATGATIYAAAGGTGNFSPTSVTVDLEGCG